MKITLADYLKKMRPFIDMEKVSSQGLGVMAGNRHSTADYVMAVFENIIEPGRDDHQGRCRTTAASRQLEDSGEHPLGDLVASSVRRIYSKPDGLSRAKAVRVMARMNKDRFAQFLNDCSSLDGVVLMGGMLTEWGLTVPEEEEALYCAHVLGELILARSRGEESVNLGNTEWGIAASDGAAESFPGRTNEDDGAEGGRSVHRRLPNDPLPDALLPGEGPYVRAVLATYAQALGVSGMTLESLSEYPYYLMHLKHQRQCFVAAETLRHALRDVYPEDSPFEELLDNVYAGVAEKLLKRHKSGLERLEAVLERAEDMNLSHCQVQRETQWMEIDRCKGACHHLVERPGAYSIDGWVRADDTEGVS